MNEPPEIPAWLEIVGGERVPLRGNCALGRSPHNDVPLVDRRVSRRHAIIHAQGDHEFWLVDLGSSNGTSLNGRRVSQPMRLWDGDRIGVGPFELVFRQPGATGEPAAFTEHTQATLVDLKVARTWLLVADIAGSTGLSQKLPADEVAVLFGGWFRRCREVIEARGGTINKYLGDGFLAYWPESPDAPDQVAAVLASLGPIQDAAQPPFRVVVHCGTVFLGGAAAQGEENLSGPEVNYVFRMEKLAQRGGWPRLLSDPARRALGGRVAAEPVGEHELPGFSGLHAFHRV